MDGNVDGMASRGIKTFNGSENFSKFYDSEGSHHNLYGAERIYSLYCLKSACCLNSIIIVDRIPKLINGQIKVCFAYGLDGCCRCSFEHGTRREEPETACNCKEPKGEPRTPPPVACAAAMLRERIFPAAAPPGSGGCRSWSSMSTSLLANKDDRYMLVALMVDVF